MKISPLSQELQVNSLHEPSIEAARVVCKCGESDPSMFYSQQYRGRTRITKPCKRCRRASAQRRREEPDFVRDPVANRAAVKRWRKRHPEQHRARQRKTARRRRQKKRVNGDPISIEYADILRHDPCSYCGKPMDHIDHIDPLSRFNDSQWFNLTSACGSCNSRKGTKFLIFFLATR